MSLGRHNLPSKVRLRNNQTTRNVYNGCNNNVIFPDRAIFHVSYHRRIPATLILPRQSLGGSRQSSKMATLLNWSSFVFKISFLPKYRVIYYEYIVKWCILCNWCVSMDIA